MEEIIVLGQWEKAKRAIAECSSIDEVKKIRDKAEALRAYAKQAKESLEVQNNVAEIKIRCERKIGEFSLGMTTNKGKYQQTSHDGNSDKLILLKEAGIEHYERYETIANLPQDLFEIHIKEIKKSNEELTTVGILRIARELEKNKRMENENVLRKKNTSDLDIRRGDFKKVLNNIKNIDAIITDPPYPLEFIDCFSELGKYAKEHLKEGGFLVVYSGQYHLPEVIKRLSEHLTYVWTFCLYHKGTSQLVNGVNIMCGWKPILIFSKGNKKMRFSSYDVVVSENMEKFSHKWQQSESGVSELIKIFSKPNELVVDPFAGSGTFVKVAIELGRKSIGAEIK